jgi:hypothetical protein
MAPEKISKYTCRTAGHPIAITDNNAYTNANITVPDNTFAKRRSDKEIGTARSPMILIGAQIGHGSHNPLMTPLTF